MPTVAGEVVTSVLEEFQHVSKAVESVARGGVEYAQQILETALGSSRARAVLEKIQEQITDSGLKRLRKAAPEALAGILRGEHPQTIALILAHLDVRQASKVVRGHGPRSGRRRALPRRADGARSRPRCWRWSRPG